MRKVIPFTAIVGQEKAKKALIYAAINPKVGGVLLTGQKGTAKSTLVRAFGQLLLDTKIVELPINATLDQLIGTIDIQETLSTNSKKAQFGILKKANSNILYIDEVNLLAQSIVYALLDVWAYGVTHVEREGFSKQYQSQFSVIGTMNPEEGGLNPEFLDRFGLYVELESLINIQSRKDVIKAWLEYEKKPETVHEQYKEQERSLFQKIAQAKRLLHNVNVSEKLMQFTVDLCIQANVQGHRADIYLIQTAMAISAYNGEEEVSKEAIIEAAEYVLPHRIREQAEQEDEVEVEENPPEEQDNQNQNEQPMNNPNNGKMNQPTQCGEKNEEEFTGDADTIYSMDLMNGLKKDKKKRVGTGRRSKSMSGTTTGRYVGFQFPTSNNINDIAFDATVRVAAMYQKSRREKAKSTRFIIEKSDVRIKKREKKVGRTIVFAVDASGSMGARNRITATKNAILSLLYNAYQKRDKVAMIVFRKDKAEVVLPITKSKDLAYKKLQRIVAGGRTPLAQGIDKSRKMIVAEMLKDKDMLPLFVLITDGKANQSISNEDPVKESIKAAEKIKYSGIDSIIIDTENDYISFELAKDIAQAMDGDYYKIDDVKGKNILNIINER